MNDSSEPIIYRGVDVLLRNAKILLLLSFVGALAGVAISYRFTPVFKADAILIASDELLGLGQNSQLGGLGGLASLVGIGGTGNKEAEAIAILKSRGLVYAY